MTLINTLLVPLIISGLPLISILTLSRIKNIKESFVLTAITTIIAVLIGFATPIYACLVSAKGLLQNQSVNQSNCVTGSAIFLPIGVLMTISALVLGVNNGISTYKLNFVRTKRKNLE
ncbi:hypothetical protein [Adhaeribacter radiodurans]|uniref:Uncharacterized protein n=1 Tax=Adhaeribacter radiodurans TaxID=2745197 RepID=A0A7L7LAA8_9BACT|nr:hypothetical protein [Adhaeribacter radiodurans]QMU29768.1 hypothetical protein HUW48_17840 [Adhaeribacter radiodurans]